MYKRQPHQNLSKMVVPMAAEAYFLHGTDPLEFLIRHKQKKFERREDNPMFDFMISTKVPRSSRLVTCPVKIEGYGEYDLKYGYPKLPGLREIHEDSFEQDMNVMLISTKKTRINNGSDSSSEKKYIEENREIHIGPETEQNRVARYFISNSTDDPFLIKIMPPLKSKLEDGERKFNIESGFHVKITTDSKDFDWDRLNLQYYVREIEKLIELPDKKIEEL